MARPTGRDPHDAESVQAAAATVFAEKGFHATNMADIAAVLGIHKTSLYHHVAGKEALLETVLDRAFLALEGATAKALAEEGTAAVRLRRLVRGVVATSLGDALPYVRLLLRVRDTTPPGRQAIARRRAFDADLAGLVEQAQRDGDIRAYLDPEVVARLVYGMINSTAEWYRPGHRLGPDHLADTIATVMLDGLCDRHH